MLVFSYILITNIAVFIAIKQILTCASHPAIFQSNIATNISIFFKSPIHILIIYHTNLICLWKLLCLIIISMKPTLIHSILNRPSLTIKQLQQSIQRPTPTHNQQTTADHHHHHHKEMVIKSPFYQRINHKPDCSCPFHKRKKYQPNINKRFKTQADQQKMRNTIAHENADDIYSKIMKDHLENPYVISQSYKKYYFEYLRTLPQFNKFNRHDKLDCYNELFQELLKSRYLITLEQPKSEKDKRHHHKSQKSMKSMKTQNNIIFLKNQSKKENIDSMQELRSGGSQNLKVKRIGFKQTVKTLQSINEEGMKAKHGQNKKKRAKFNQHRSSFFGLLDDQQVLRELCVKFMAFDQKSYKQGQLIVKKLVQLDANVYKQMISEMQEDIIAGAVKVKDLSDQQANILIKIVLNKIKDETKASNDKNQSYSDKNALIDELCNKYGWMESQEALELKHFWAMRRQKKKSNELQSRKSLSRQNVFNEKQIKRHKNMERQHTQTKSDRSNKMIKSRGPMIQEQCELNSGKQLKLSSFYKKEISFKQKYEKPEQENGQFKLNNTKTILKKSHIHKKTTKSKFKDAEKENTDLNKSNRDKRSQVPMRKETYYFNEALEDQEGRELKQKETAERLSIQQENERHESLFVYLRNHVLNHMELHKNFVKKVQSYLTEGNCETIIIGFGQSLITKRRKIRAIQQFLKNDDFSQSEYCKDLQKYIDIFEEYCDLVINKRNLYKKIKLRKNSQNLTIDNDQQDIQGKEMSQDQQISCLFNELKKDRELKFIDIHFMHKKQDPKQELIIKIPQYISNKEKSKMIVDNPFSMHPVKKQDASKDYYRPRQSDMGQKQLAQKVHLIFEDLKPKGQQNEQTIRKESKRAQGTLQSKLKYFVNKLRKSS